MTTVGYLGMGIMGSAMTANLIKGGFSLIVWNRTPARCEPLAKLGARVAASPADVARMKPDVICINVTDTPDVEAVLFGAQGVARGAARDLIVVDHSTINPDATCEFARRLQQQGVTFLDAPVSGGDIGARNGTLTIMVGGPKPAFEKCMPVFKAVGKTITHVGDAGMGQMCKACNQIAVVTALMGACEAIALAKRSGLDPRKMIDVVVGGSGQSWQLANLGPKILNGDFAPGFMIDLVLKDLAIVMKAGQEKGLELAGAAAARKYLQNVPDGGRLGTQAMIKAVE